MSRADHLAGDSSGGRVADLLGSPPKSVFDVIMDAPDLDTGSGSPPPPADEDGDGKPDPDWKLVGLTAFMLSFTATAAVRYAVILVKLLT